MVMLCYVLTSFRAHLTRTCSILSTDMVCWRHVFNRDKIRWLPGAKSICFNSSSSSLFFQLGRVLPVVRGEGVYQQAMNFLTDELNIGGWVHIFPEGQINMTKEFMRLKWGMYSLF